MVGQDRIKKLMDILQHIIIHNTMCFALERRKCEQFLKTSDVLFLWYQYTKTLIPTP